MIFTDAAPAIEWYTRALDAPELLRMKDQDYGDRSGGFTDPCGHVWYVASRIRDLAQ